MIKRVCYNLSFDDTCIDDITIGKTYNIDVIYYDSVFNNLYEIRNDKGDLIRYNTKLFITTEEWRERQLDKIL